MSKTLFQLYVNTEVPNQKIKFKIDYNKDTYHWATSSSKQKGYQLTATPVKREGVYEKFEAFSGFYKIIYPVDRQSKKRLSSAIEIFYDEIEKYLDFFRNKGYDIKPFKQADG